MAGLWRRRPGCRSPSRGRCARHTGELCRSGTPFHRRRRRAWRGRHSGRRCGRARSGGRTGGRRTRRWRGGARPGRRTCQSRRPCQPGRGALNAGAAEKTDLPHATDPHHGDDPHSGGSLVRRNARPCRLRHATGQPANHADRPEWRLHLPDAPETLQEPGHTGRPRLLGGRHPRCRVLLWGTGVLAAYRGRCPQRHQAAPARRRRHDHRRVGRQLHRAGLWPLRRQAVCRLRAALPQARRAGRTGLAGPEPEILGRLHRRHRRALGTGGELLRRDPFQRRDLRRPRSRRWPLHRGLGHRYLDRQPRALPAGRLQPAVLGSECPAAVARGRRIVCRARGAVHGYPQQLRWQLRFRGAPLGQAVHTIRESTAAGGARDTRAERGPGACRRQESALHPPGGRRHLRQRGHARRARCAAVARSFARGGRPHTARPCEADRGAGGQFAVLAPDQLGYFGAGSRRGGRAAQVHRRADRSLFLRGGRAVEGHRGALGHGAAPA